MARSYVVEKIFDYKGYKCAVVMQDMGHRCGYVGVPKGHELYGKDYTDIDIECHGGLTYSTFEVGSSYPIQEDNELWWFGWDYAHYGDGLDFDGIAKNFDKETYYRIRKFNDFMTGYVYYVDDVEEDCKYVIEQIIEGSCWR